MAKKATELSDLHIRRLKHHVTASGEPRAKRYSVGGVSGLYIQCSPPNGSNKTGAKSWILRTLSDSIATITISFGDYSYVTKLRR